MTNYYGCTGTHSEFTCLDAYYVGPKKYRKYSAWCDVCRAKYRDPQGNLTERGNV